MRLGTRGAPALQGPSAASTSPRDHGEGTPASRARGALGELAATVGCAERPGGRGVAARLFSAPSLRRGGTPGSVRFPSRGRGAVLPASDTTPIRGRGPGRRGTSSRFARVLRLGGRTRAGGLRRMTFGPYLTRGVSGLCPTSVLLRCPRTLSPSVKREKSGCVHRPRRLPGISGSPPLGRTPVEALRLSWRTVPKLNCETVADVL